MFPGASRFPVLLGIALAVVVAAGPAGLAAEGDRTWDLSPVYPSDDAWSEARAALEQRLPELAEHRGRLATGPGSLRDALALYFDLQKELSRLATYANLRGDEDLNAAGPQGMRQAIETTEAEMAAATSWIDPEILSIPAETLDRFRAEEPGLLPYARFLERLEKRRAHTLDADGERILGLARMVQGDGTTVGGLLRNAEIPWPTIRLSDGTELRVDPSGFSKGRNAKQREDRIAVFKAFYDQLHAFKGTLAASLYATVKEHVFNARVRNHASPLAASLHRNEVDPAVYEMLIAEVNRALPTLHRYLRLRARIMGLDDLAYHDLYPSLVPSVETRYDWPTSQRLVLESLAPLGSQYVERFRFALENRWVDVDPRPGKRSGAYVSDGAYDVHPYMLLNHIDDYRSASTLAHEGGHLMHSWYAQESQPFPTADYSIFVAEVASTCDENLFFRHLVARAANDEERLSLLGDYLELLRLTLFRQTMFAEFEKSIHQAVERGEPLTGEGLNEMYLTLVRRYYGHDDKVCEVGDHYSAEWAFIPHFHYDFYVYQYATSIVAATALSRQIAEGGPEAAARFVDFLRAGSSKPPVELLRDAGVDMTKPDPIRAAMRQMEEVIDEIEAILARREPAPSASPAHLWH